MKKGFTIIELLSIIILLAVLALIAMPIFNNLINQSREKSISYSVKNYIRSIEESVAVLKDSIEDYNGIYTIQSSGKQLVSTKTIDITFKGKNIDEGYVILKDGEVSRVINAKVDGNYVQFNNNEVIVQKDKYETPSSCFSMDNTKLTSYNVSDECDTNVVIPNIVTVIGENAFKNKNITNIVIPNNVITIETSAFAENKITSIVIPNGVVTIGANAFEENNISSVVIPSTVTSIGASAFKKNYLKTIYLPSLELIGEYAFAYNGLSKINIGTSTDPVNGTLNLTNVFQGTDDFLPYLPNSITEVTIYYANDSVTAISNTVFPWSVNSTKEINRIIVS